MAVELKKGDHSTNVALWQGFLVSQGFKDVLPDAHFGDNTEKATKGFQKMCVLREDGIVGPNTVSQAMQRGFGGFTQPATPQPAPTPDTAAVPVDPKDLGKLSKVHPQLARKVTALVNMAAAEGYTLRVTHGVRTFSEQDALFAQGRSKPGIVVTGAKAGQSNHNYGLAVDVVFVVNGKATYKPESIYHNLGRWAKACGLAWGINCAKAQYDPAKTKDFPHLELTDLPKWRVLLNLYQKGGLPEVWRLFAN